MLLSQIILVIVLMVIFPLLWYLIVNKFNLREILQKLQIKKEGMGDAFLWGILSIIFIFGICFSISIVLIYFGFNPEDQGNIEDIEAFFSPATMFILLAVQPTIEEIFFRGFLLDKIQSISGNYSAILITLCYLVWLILYPVKFILQ